MDEYEKNIITLVNSGIAYPEIASRLGVTKNAICGKVFRLRQRGLIGPPKNPVRPRTYRKRKPLVLRTITPRKKIARPVVTNEPPSKTLNIMELNASTCRFPSSGKIVTFCGHDVSKGAYCSYHAELCYIKPKKRVRIYTR